jgi:hypothetical protein
MLDLVGIAAGGISVETEVTCFFEARAQVVTPKERQGPKGSAAEVSTRLPDETEIAGAFTSRGACRTAISFSFTGRWEGRFGFSLLPNASKRLLDGEESHDA